MKGNRVHFRPGWDCHGLPIEAQVSIAGLPHSWTEKSDGGLGASPPAGVKEAAPRRMSSFLN